MKNRTTFV